MCKRVFVYRMPDSPEADGGPKGEALLMDTKSRQCGSRRGRSDWIEPRTCVKVDKRPLQSL